MLYWDTSALLKLYVPESDSDFFLRLAENTDEQIATSAIAAVEVLCSLYRKESSGALRRGGAQVVFSQFLADGNAGRIVLAPYGHRRFGACQQSGQAGCWRAQARVAPQLGFDSLGHGDGGGRQDHGRHRSTAQRSGWSCEAALLP